MRRTCMIALAMYSCLAGRAFTAQESGYSDDEVKAQFVEAGMFCHAEFIRRGYRRAFEMAGCDTNRYCGREHQRDGMGDCKPWYIQDQREPSVPVFLRHERRLRRKGVEGSIRHRGRDEQLYCGDSELFVADKFIAE